MAETTLMTQTGLGDLDQWGTFWRSLPARKDPYGALVDDGAGADAERVVGKGGEIVGEGHAGREAGGDTVTSQAVAEAVVGASPLVDGILPDFNG